MGENNEAEMEVIMVELEEEDVGEEEVKWEEFMPKNMLRVLLVEADDSTRQILTALLRKCNYKVAAIADGLQAWEVLKRQHNNIDIVLTELDLPSISGYALLTLIMEHDVCKNIPVIMTSSQDSISMVLKCMLKGAADFLIKPIRKNELKNLWRHVWRRLAISDGHDPQNLATRQHEVEATIENNPGTNHSGDNVSTSPESSKCSGKATNAEDLSWMKYSEETGLRNKEMEHNLKNIKLEKELPLLTTVVEGKAARSESGNQSNNEGDVSVALREDEDGSCTGIATEDESVGQTNYKHKANGNDLRLYDPCRGAIDLIGSMKRQKCIVEQTSSAGDFSNHNSKPELELSLRRVHDSETKEVDERRKLNHSNASAFSWYNINKKSQTSSPLSISEPTEANGIADSSRWPKTLNSIQDEKPIAGPRSFWAGYAPMEQPIFSSLAGPGPDIPAKSMISAFQREESPFLTSPSLHSDPGTHSSTVNDSSGPTERDFPPIVGPSSSITRCHESNDQTKTSVCESASDLTELNNANVPGIAGISAIKEVVKHDSCNSFELDQFRHRTVLQSVQREAALAKFRLKRKGRCYEKKVRYQSRKKLAEQRTRVKGQFVRQIPTVQMLIDDVKT